MDKRPLMAMGFMLLLLLVFQLFFIPQQPQRESGSAPETGQAAPGQVGARVSGVAGDAGTREAADSVAGQAPRLLGLGGLALEDGPGRPVVVETPLYRAEFSTRGAVLTSFRLKRFKAATGEPVELVPEAESLPFGAALLTASGERFDLGAVGFAASGEGLVVPEGVEASLKFDVLTPAGLALSKVFTFRGGAYTIGASVRIGGPGVEGLRAVEFGWQSGLAATETNREDDLRNFAAVTLTDQELVKHDLGKVKKGQQGAVSGAIAWSGLRSKYFLVGFVPAAGRAVVAKATLGTPESIGMVIEADNPSNPLDCLVYAGPLDYEGLKATGFKLERAVDFGWKWIGPLSKLIYKFLVYCYKVVPNYGWVIIILSGLIKLLFHPLTAKSMRSMREMQRVQPELKALREKYKKEPHKLNSAMMELYKKRGINPVGGCLPLLLQMPVFFALFNVLSKTIELRQAPFIFWINDLSAPDRIAGLPFSIPFIGSTVSLLPILMGVAMYIQQKMTPTDPKQALLTYLMPIIFTVMFFKFPSGLVLYWLVNNVLTIIHQYWMNRADRLKQEAAPVAAG